MSHASQKRYCRFSVTFAVIFESLRRLISFFIAATSALSHWPTSSGITRVCTTTDLPSGSHLGVASA